MIGVKMIDLVSLKLWIEDELNNGHRSKASRINKIYGKYFSQRSIYEQNQILYKINKLKLNRYKLERLAGQITNEFFE
jgi:hypothetical protein